VFIYIADRAISEVEKVHDIAVTSVAPSKTIVGERCIMSINVTVLNQGDFLGIFNLTVYANTTIVQAQEIRLPVEESKNITFEWNTTDIPLGNYTIKAVADVVDNETIITNNTFIHGIVTVSLLGDINADTIVDIIDISTAARAFGTKFGDHKWDSNADINEDWVINILDLSAIAKEYGKSLASRAKIQPLRSF